MATATTITDSTTGRQVFGTACAVNLRTGTRTSTTKITARTTTTGTTTTRTAGTTTTGTTTTATRTTETTLVATHIDNAMFVTKLPD
jgi:hypothetical protein